MADSDSHLGPGYGRGHAPRTPSIGPSNRTSADGTHSQDNLLSGIAVDNNSRRELGDSVPDAPSRVEERVAENPEHATNSRLVSLQPELVPPDDLKYWPVILQWRAVTCLVLLYTATGTAIGVLMWKSIQDSSHNFRLSSENVHMISRYFPSVIGTVTVLFFRQTVREALRMVPFVAMADQNGKVNKGSEPWKGVGGAWFPWQSFTTTPNSCISFFSLICQFAVSYIVSLKVALFASAPPKFDNDLNAPYWILTVRVYPAAVLILGYIMMIIYTLYISWHFRGKSTGLKWDPVSIADYASLFAHCNALQYFAPLELRHDLRPVHVMVPDRCFRLGYWTRVRRNPGQIDTVTDTVYGIGVAFDGHIAHSDTGISQKERKVLGRPWTYVVTFRPNKPPPEPVDKCNREGTCAHGTWPDCEHYPYNYNPGCSRWVIALASLLPIGGLALCIYALVIRLPEKGFSLPNSLKFPSTIYYGWGSSNHILPPIDPADPNSTVLLWALMFRSAPTYVAGIFTSTIITWIDLNMRFMQPFRNMFGEVPNISFGRRVIDFIGWPWWRRKTASSAIEAEPEDRTPATAAESILLAYMTVSPLQVPLTAWDKGHYKVCIYSTLSTLSPLFPIFVGGLLTVTPDETYDRVNFSFSLSAYIGIMVSLALYSILLPTAMPGAYRLLPRQLYSLADLMAMCHESKFMASPHLDIADRDRTPSKEHMEARLLLTDDRFLFGRYRGRDGKRHIGFDIKQERDPDFGPLRNLEDSVEHIPPEGLAAKAQRTMTKILEEGRKKGKTITGAMKLNKRSPFAQRRHLRSGDEQEGTELPLMSGGLVPPRARAEASGSQVPQRGSGSRTRPARPDLLHG